MVRFTRTLRKDGTIEVLDMIDPTAMETVHDILDIVISRMFEQFRKDKERVEREGGGSPIMLDRDQQLKLKQDVEAILDSKALGIEKGLLRLLYKRTGLLLVAKEDEIHPLIPGTLRELVGMVALIGNMEEEERQWLLSLREVGVKGVHNAVFLQLYDWLTENDYLNAGDKRRTAPGAEFSLNNLFIRQLGIRAVYRNINAEKWGLEETDQFLDTLPLCWKHFRELCEILVCNMEAVHFIGQYLTDTRNIKEKTDNAISVYYRHFFKSLVDGMLRLDQYPELGTGWMTDGGWNGEADQLAAALAEFRNSRQGTGTEEAEEETDEERISAADSDVSMKNVISLSQKEHIRLENETDFPSYVRKDSSVGNFEFKLNQLAAYTAGMSGIGPSPELDEAAKELEHLKKELDTYKKTHTGSNTIDGDLSSKFNHIRRNLL